MDSGARAGAERRIAVRVVYETVAMVAEYDGVNFPLYSAFWEVQTTDLSATGIGFLSSRRPTTERLLILLGNPQANPIFIEELGASGKESEVDFGVMGGQWVVPQANKLYPLTNKGSNRP